MKKKNNEIMIKVDYQLYLITVVFEYPSNKIES